MYNNRFFVNGAMPSTLVFVTNHALSDEQAKEFYKRLDKRHGGAVNAHKPMLWDGTAGEPKNIGLTQRDMEFLKTLEWTVEDAARVWGVPVPLMMSMVQSTFNNLKESRVWFYTGTIEPEWSFISEEINELFIPLVSGGRGRSDIFVTFDTSQILPLQEAMTELYERDRADIDSGVLTINEVRAKRNLEPVAWGDVWWAKGVVTPVEDATIEVESSEAAFGEDEERRYKALPQPDLDAVAKAFSDRYDAGVTGFSAMQRRLFERQRRDVIRRLNDMVPKGITEVVWEGEIPHAVHRQGPSSPLFHPADWLETFKDSGERLIATMLITEGRDHSDEFGLGGIDTDAPEIDEWVKDRTDFWARRVNDETARMIVNEMAQGLAAEESIPDLQRRVENVFAFNDTVRSERIARTEILGAANQGHLEAYRQSGVVEEKRWIATLDERTTRPDHLAAHRQVVPFESKFIVGGELLDAPGVGGSAKNTINCRCVPGETFVRASGIEAVTRRWYEGDLVEITTSSGYKLAGTPNHPILTDTGWVGLGRLSKGDNVAHSSRGNDFFTPLSRPDVDDMPTPISQVYDTLSLSPLVGGAAHRVRGSVMQFHGDGRRGHVDVVFPDDVLWNQRQTGVFEQLAEFKLSLTERKMGLTGDPASDFRVLQSQFVGIRASTGCYSLGTKPSVDNVPVSSVVLGDSINRHAGLVEHGNFGFVNTFSGAASRRSPFTNNPLSLSRSSENAAFYDGRAKSFVSNMEFPTEIVDTPTSDVGFDRIVNITITRFAGHVYNLQTPDFTFEANGIITHNCTVAPVVKSARKAANLPEPRALPEASKNGHAVVS